MVVLLGYTLAQYLTIFSCRGRGDTAPGDFFNVLLELVPIGIVGSAYGPWEELRKTYGMPPAALFGPVPVLFPATKGQGVIGLGCWARVRRPQRSEGRWAA